MIYLFLECKSDTSEYVFWKDVIEFPGTIICCGGNTHVVNDLKQIENVLQSGDSIYVCYDYINMYSSVLGSIVTLRYNTVKAELRRLKLNYDIKCYILKDLCFEAMLYRVSNLLPKPSLDAGVQTFVQQIYTSSKQSFASCTNVFRMARQRGITNEDYVAQLLHDSTNCAHMQVTKGTLGRCWTSDCAYKNYKGKNLLSYQAMDGKTGFCGVVENPLCIFCGHLFKCKNSYNAYVCYEKNWYKQSKILGELCNGDWHNLFEKV